MKLEEVRKLKKKLQKILDNPCPKCKGTGKVRGKVCDRCGGAGTVGAAKAELIKPVNRQPAPAMPRPKRYRG